MIVEILLDGGLEFGNASEDAASDAVLSDQAEEALDLVEPGCRGGSEVHVEARMTFEPCLDRRVLVGGVVVGDQMHVEGFGRDAIDGPQETQPFLMAMPLHALADHPTRRNIEAANSVVVPWRL